MSERFTIRQSEQAWLRKAAFAVELLDAVTLLRVSVGVEVKAEGLRGKPIVNTGGLFVWLKETNGVVRSIRVDPRTLPYERVERAAADLRLPPQPRPVTPVELPPRVNYPFPAGITGLRGTLIEEQVADPSRRVPVRNAEVHLRWLEDDGVTWHDSPAMTHTTPKGDFVSFLRLGATDAPQADAGGALTVRLRVRRNGNERGSADLKLLQGRVTDPTSVNALRFAWGDLQP